MKRKLLAVLYYTPTVCIVVLVTLYFLLAMYYRNGFSYNTWVNGVYCTGKNIEDINSVLKSRYETRSIEIHNTDGSVEYILPDEINYRIDFTEYLKSIQKKQNPFLWILNFTDWKAGADIEPSFTFEEDALDYYVDNLSFVKNNTNDSVPYTAIKLTDNGYELIDTYRPYVDRKAVLDAVKVGLYSEEPVELSENYLIKPVYADKDLKVLKEWDSLKKYLEPKLTYDMGAEQISIDSSVLSDFLIVGENGEFVKNEDGSFAIDEEKAVKYMDNLCSSYDTYGKDRVFTTIKGEEKVIKNVYYGTLLNHKAECEYFVNALKTGISEVHTPSYIRKGYVRGLDDIGNTYIEIDMNEQVLYYFEDGVINLHCDIVSGRPGYNATPQMICSVFNKKKAAILRGADYASYVDYWMAIYQGIGLHDASWQRAFGGERYKTHGSHGCINMRKGDAERLYDSIELGIPVILYY